MTFEQGNDNVVREHHGTVRGLPYITTEYPDRFVTRVFRYVPPLEKQQKVVVTYKQAVQRFHLDALEKDRTDAANALHNMKL